MKKKEKKPVNRAGWKTSKKERINYYIGDIGRTLEGYIVTAFMTLLLLFQGINLVKISAAILVVKAIDAFHMKETGLIQIRDMPYTSEGGFRKESYT